MINIAILKMSTHILRNELQNIIFSSQWLINIGSFFPELKLGKKIVSLVVVKTEFFCNNFILSSQV